MSYSLPNRRSYSFPNVAFGTSSFQTVTGPKGKAGRIVAINVAATVLFTNVTTAGRVDLGNATTANANQSLALGALAASASISSDDAVSTFTNTTPVVAADVPLKVSFIAPTGGSPAGTATVTVIMDWDD